MTPEGEKTDPIEQWNEEVSQLYDIALASSDKQQAGLMVVTTEMATRFLAEASVDVSDFFHVLDADGIRHIHKKHGAIGEYARGQIPIIKQDVLDLRLVTTNPDTINRSVKSHQGLVAIELTKELHGYTLYYVEVVRTGREQLAPVSLYKRKTK